MNRTKILLWIFAIVIIAVTLYLFFLPSINLFQYFLHWKNKEGFVNPPYQYAYTNKWDEGDQKNPIPLEYGYMDPNKDSDYDKDHKYKSIFPLEPMPSNGIAPYGYDGTANKQFIIPNTQDTIYASIEKMKTAMIGGTMVEVPLYIIGDRNIAESTVSTSSNITRINTNFFEKINIKWSIKRPPIATAIYTVGEVDKDKDDIMYRDPSGVYLFFYGSTSSPRIDTPILTVNTYRSTPYILYHVDSTSNDLETKNDRILIQSLCRTLGLTDREDDNIMKTGSKISSEKITNAQIRVMMNHIEKLTNIKTSIAVNNNNNNISPELQAVLDKVEQKLEDYRDSYYDTIEYHKTEQEIRNEIKQDSTDVAYVIDKNGNRVALGKVKTQPDQLYYTAGSYPFGSANYVPKYEDSVYLSKLTGETMATPLENTAAMQGGFCTQEAHNPLKIDEMCQAMDKNKCASTSCCVLLGGAKCVGGTGNGPTMTGHYSDVTIRDRDYYYYQGKCYGNCPQHNPF
jgi:hypothetical protein